jgi:hypothetical protein
MLDPQEAELCNPRPRLLNFPFHFDQLGTLISITYLEQEQSD